MKAWNARQEHKEKNRIRLLEMNKLKGYRVEVLDTLNNEVSVYNLMSEGDLAIGCSRGTIRSALNHLQENGVSRLIKKRYKVKIINDES